MKNIEQITFWNMKDGKKYVGILDDIDWEKREFKIKQGAEIRFHKIEGNLDPKEYIEKIKSLYNCVSSYNRKEYSNIKLDEIKNAYIIN